MVYSDVIDWLKEKNFPDRQQAENYIKSHQQGIIYSQQMDALDFYFKEKEEPFRYENQFATRPMTPLQQLQEQQAERQVPPPEATQPSVPTTVQQQQVQETRLRRVLRRLFGR